MGYQIKAIDITEFKFDVIINSLGSGNNITSYGSLCKNIVKKAGFNLELDIKKHKKDSTPGNMFVTSGYKLETPNIIHIFTPFYVNDKQMYQLEYVYMRALKEALDNKWRKVGVPIIGTGANGYPFGFVSRMVENLVKKFVELYPKMDVTICKPIEDFKEFDDKFDEDRINKALEKFYKRYPDVKMRDFVYNDERCFEECYDRHREDGTIFSSVDMAEHEYRAKFMIDLDDYKEQVKFRDELEAVLESGKRPVKVDYVKRNIDNITMYIERYMEIRFKEDSIKILKNHVKNYLNGNTDSSSLGTKHGKSKSRDTVSVSTLMRYVLALHMNREEADDFLKFCGRCFSPISRADKVYISMIEKKRFDNKGFINEECEYMKIDKIFGYNLESEGK